MKKAVLQLETLTCPSCIQKIEATLSRTEGVHAVKVLFNSSKVKAEFDEAAVNVMQLQQIIDKLGYSVQSAKVI